MLRWEEVEEKELYGETIKMYRDPFVTASSSKAIYKGLELDHYAYKYLSSELFMYKILDTNFTEYIEERGDVSRLKNIQIPAEVDETRTVY